MTVDQARTVLISGASIAGAALAFWLKRHGFRVTVVEKASALRAGGYPIDIRGAALRVADRMGITERLKAAHIDTRKLSFYRQEGRLAGSLRPDAISGGVEGRDLEVPRGELASALTDLLGNDVDLIFNDSITTLNDCGSHLDVAFASKRRQPFDLVIGADGLHSNVRRLAFGPEDQFHRYLGYCFAGFSIPNDLGLAHEAIMLNAPGKAATLLCPGDSDTLHAMLLFSRSNPPFREHGDLASQRRLVSDTFAGLGWEIPRMLQAMHDAEDLYFDTISQIHMPAWSRGRVALVGDAAYAPSFLSGQGSSIAIVGAYILAGELAANADHARAFASYGRRARPFVERNQALARQGKRFLAPTTGLGLMVRNQVIRLAPLLNRAGLISPTGQDAYSAIDLPPYGSHADSQIDLRSEPAGA